MLLEHLSYEQAVAKQSFFFSMRADPLMTAIHFDRRFSALMKFVVNSPVKPLGLVKDYFIHVEFQRRGSPHYNIFLGARMFQTRLMITPDKLFYNTFLTPFIHIYPQKLKMQSCINW